MEEQDLGVISMVKEGKQLIVFHINPWQFLFLTNCTVIDARINSVKIVRGDFYYITRDAQD